MIFLDTLFGSKIATSVKIGEVYYPINLATQALRYYSEPALFITEHVINYQLSKSGSAFKFKLLGKYFVVCTRHQLNSYSLDQFGLQGADPANIVTSNAALTSNDHDDDFDCCLFDFSDGVNSGSISKSSWYDISSDLNEGGLPKPIRVVAIGYPGHRNVIDYERQTFGASPNAVWGTESKSSIKNRLAFDVTPTIDFDPKGMSGGPVFGLHTSSNSVKVFFCGIVTNASRKKFNFIPISSIRIMIANIMEQDVD